MSELYVEIQTGIFDLAKAVKKLPEGITQYTSLLTDKGWSFSYPKPR